MDTRQHRTRQYGYDESMRTLFSSCLLILLTTLTPIITDALSPYQTGSTGIDVSWPSENCRSVKSGTLKTAFAVIGVNHGLDFTGNTCLVQEVSPFNDYALYLNTGYPGKSYGLKYKSTPEKCTKSDYQCLAFNYGFNDVRYSITYTDLRNVHTTNWWLDVETDNSWTTNPAINTASLLGMIAGLRYYTFLPSIGFYAFPGQWDQITSSWQSGIPAWVATGTTSRKASLLACHELSFTGGKIVLTQYTLKLDEDYAC
jgi:hypothetical protein